MYIRQINIGFRKSGVVVATGDYAMTITDREVGEMRADPHGEHLIRFIRLVREASKHKSRRNRGGEWETTCFFDAGIAAAPIFRACVAHGHQLSVKQFVVLGKIILRAPAQVDLDLLHKEKRLKVLTGEGNPLALQGKVAWAFLQEMLWLTPGAYASFRKQGEMAELDKAGEEDFYLVKYKDTDGKLCVVAGVANYKAFGRLIGRGGKNIQRLRDMFRAAEISFDVKNLSSKPEIDPEMVPDDPGDVGASASEIKPDVRLLPAIVTNNDGDEEDAA